MEKSGYLLAIDAGTGSVRAVLFDFDGNQVGCVQQEWTHKEDPRYPGSMDFDWAYNWKLACECIRGVIKEADISASEIAAISTTCMREGILLYDKDGKELWACANVDARSTDEAASLIKSDKNLELKLYRKSGQSFALNAIPRLLWVKNKLPEIYEKTDKIGMFNDWLIYKLTHVLAVEPSNGSTTGLFDLQTRSWDESIPIACGLRGDIFPTVLESGQIAGKVTSLAAEETGLTAGTTVVVGGGDCQLGTIGVGAVNPGEAAVFGGSFWQYEFNTGDGKTDEEGRVRVNCHAVPGVWQYEALAFKPGLVMRWYRDAFCQEEIALGTKLGKDPYDLMNEKAKDIPVGSNGMMCCFSDVMNFINWKHAAPTFTNFELEAERYNKYTFYRAILENTALLVKGHIDLVKEATGHEPNRLIFAGGASVSDLWAQILADATGKTVITPVVKEATALGAAIIAGYGAGIYPSIAEGARRCAKTDKTFTPTPAHTKIYNEMYPVWRKLYQAQLHLCDQKITKNMWIAPGL